MSGVRAWFARLGGLFGRERRDRELEAEMASHLAMHIEDNVRAGMTAEEARRQAVLRLGGVEQAKESYRERRGLPWLETLTRDIRYGLRMLAKTPTLTFILAITLALGIGANAAIFSIVDSFLIRPLPVPHAQEIVRLASHQIGGSAPLGVTAFSYADLDDFRKQSVDTFSDLFVYQPVIVGLSADGRADQLLGSYVSGNYFSALGLEPALGRLFLPGEGERPGDPPYLVLAYSYWQRRFGGDRSVIGKQVRLDGAPATIIGVAPKGFHGTYSILDMDGYLPLSMFAQGPELSGLFAVRQMRTLRAMGRLKTGVSVAQAQSVANVIAERLANQYPDADKGISVRVIPEPLSRPDPDVGRMVPAVAGLFLLLAGLVLLLACLNVANILIARATVREREMAVRSALGAGRTRLMRQVLTEAILLALLGAAAGGILGALASRSVNSILPKSNPPFRFDFSFDWRVFAYTLGVALLSGFVVGLWPALRAARTNLNAVLHDGGRNESAGANRHRVRSALVVIQVAGSLALLVVAGLFVRSLGRAQQTYLGFDPTHLLNVIVDPHEIGYDEARANQFYRELEERVRALPGVQSASLAFNFPLGSFTNGRAIEVEGHPPPVGQQPPVVLFNQVDTAYFETMRVPLLRGRTFTDSDDETSPAVAIVNRTMAEKFWPGQDAMGKRFRVVGAAGGFAEIVGIAGNGQYMIMGEPPQPFFYLPLKQSYSSMRTLQIRSFIPPESLLLEVQQEVRSLAPDLPIYDAETMEQALAGGNGYFVYRFGATMAGVMGFVGLILATVGVYGVMSFSTTQRTREIGIRVALGATARDILGLVLREGLAIILAGVGVGLVGGWALTRGMGRFAAGPSRAGFLVFAGAALLLSCVALAACWIPAWRASRVDPMVALRYE
jgi:predicted permease